VSGHDLPSEPFERAVACVIPAKDEAERIAATVDAVHKIIGVDLVVVVDDGSSDGTAEAAQRAGAVVVRHERNRGKAAAMETGAAAVAERDGARARHLLFLDADLTDSATAAGGPLIEPVQSGNADMTIGTLPAQVRADGSKAGGHGFVVRLARAGIEEATGWAPEQPLSGQRCLTRVAFDAAVPLAAGFGVETALSIDLGRKGFRILEVPIDVKHRATGTDLRGQLHRGRQYLHVRRALAARSALPAGSGPSLRSLFSRKSQ
jgi:glycosyltransferase involved in cell wall biosynthesis